MFYYYVFFKDQLFSLVLVEISIIQVLKYVLLSTRSNDIKIHSNIIILFLACSLHFKSTVQDTSVFANNVQMPNRRTVGEMLANSNEDALQRSYHRVRRLYK